jgi:thioredoxin-like negative regulator of GroEL
MGSDHVTAVGVHNFEAFVARPGMVVIDCSAQWCPPCRVFEPIFAAAAAAATGRPDLAFASLDTDHEPVLAARLDIRSQPTIVFLRGGAVIYKQVGAMSAAKLDELLDRITRA